ncbi:MAG: hypothetical protein M1832_000743 [Thelocarpon impressellum]|nr:MAG: hypothetical protein M1832_000743 [Thelocarpon impressellum]
MQMVEPQLAERVRAELLKPKLNTMTPHLWLMTTLLAVAENPGLHLVSAYDRIYVKPMPEFLLSHAFLVALPCRRSIAPGRGPGRSPGGGVRLRRTPAHPVRHLARLNVWAKGLLRQFTYDEAHGHDSTYLARFYGPLLFVLALFSIALGAMQVEVSAQTLPDPGAGPWAPFTRASRGFAVFSHLGV